MLSEYKSAGISSKLWWDRNDYFSFQQSANSEIRLLRAYENICAKTARDRLYQPCSVDDEEDDAILNACSSTSNLSDGTNSNTSSRNNSVDNDYRNENDINDMNDKINGNENNPVGKSVPFVGLSKEDIEGFENAQNQCSNTTHDCINSDGNDVQSVPSDDWILEGEQLDLNSDSSSPVHGGMLGSLDKMPDIGSLSEPYPPPSPAMRCIRPGFGRKSSLDCIPTSLKTSHPSKLKMSESNSDFLSSQGDTLSLCVPLAHGVQLDFESGNKRRRGSKSKSPMPLLLCSISIILVVTLVLFENKATLLQLFSFMSKSPDGH